MLYITIERTVRRPPEIVWDFLTDVEALSSWVSGLAEARIAGETLRGAGMLIDIALDANGKRHRAMCEVTASREPSMLAVETRAPGILVLDRATLTPSPEGTELAVHAELMLGTRFVERFVLSRVLGVAERDAEIRAVHERSLDALVKRIETLSTVPYR